jgi:nucleotide-binding universal stress UspA family protein
MTTNKVIVGVDGSDPGAQALRWALALADASGWEVEAVLTWGFLDQHHADREDRFDDEYDEAHARAALDAYVVEAVGDAADRVGRRTMCDLPARGLLEAAAGAELLVVGARGLGGFKGLLLGSVSQHCLHHATGPVAIVHGGTEGAEASAPGPIVVGVDGSPHGDTALRWALARAAALGTEVHALHAWHPPYFGPDPFAFTPPAWDDCQQAAAKVVAQAVQRAGASPDDVRVTAVDGPAAPVLIEASADASMVVMGARGLGGFSGLLLGSVSTQVARHAHCPVVVVRGEPG